MGKQKKAYFSPNKLQSAFTIAELSGRNGLRFLGTTRIHSILTNTAL
ncbi:hypothetical protein [Bacillus rubiinfantis]|nr:hypothetical protein [Bacillus rubiinfantis]